MNEYKNKLMHQRIRPNKLRRIANLIRNKELNDALQLLKLLPHKGSDVIYKMLLSSYANAKHSNQNLDAKYIINKIEINEGPRQKRSKARARGRLFGIIKRSSHILLSIREKGE